MWRREKDLANGFGVDVYAVDAWYEVSAIAFEEDDVLWPAEVFV